MRMKYQNSKNSSVIEKTSTLFKYSPYIDDDGILRVKEELMLRMYQSLMSNGQLSFLASKTQTNEDSAFMLVRHKKNVHGTI